MEGSSIYLAFFTLFVSVCIACLFSLCSKGQRERKSDFPSADMEGCSSTGVETFKHYVPSSAQHDKKYHVFLSFRGTDIRKKLVDHLYQSLCSAGFLVFLDSVEIDKGTNIGDSLKEAIRNSTIHIPIFSTDFATSAWCLEELSLISTCESRVIPLFYDVEPSDVRYPDKKGPYVVAFQEHIKKNRHSKEEIDAWIEALHRVSFLSGWSLSETAAGYEATLVKQVIMDLQKALNIGTLDVAKHPVGLSDPMEEVTRLLEMNNRSHHVLVVGIWGMGGLGKTTLAKSVYNKIHSSFEASCFVSDVRVGASIGKQGLLKSQKQILQDLAKVDKSILDSWHSVDQVKNEMRNRLTSIQALVILDNVDEEAQLDALVGDAGNGYWFGRGSRIIVTTRDSQVLQRQVGRILYEMRGLDPKEGMKLFCWHAFLRADPAEGYEDITAKIVDACKGLPLSLEVVGARLYGEKSSEIWSEARTNLVKMHKDLYCSLKISYDALLDEEKRIFLDIACLFIYLSYLRQMTYLETMYFDPSSILEFCVKLWKALGCTNPYTCLQNLERKSLIRIDNNGGHCCGFSIFWMHDLLWDLARQMVEEESRGNPAERSRFWRHKELVRAMGTQEGMPKVGGHELDFSQVEGEEREEELMQNLKLCLVVTYLNNGGG